MLIAYVDRDLVYRFVNKAYEQALGLSRDEICGRRVNEVLGRESFLEREVHMEGALAGIRQSFEVATLDEAGGRRYAEATYIPQFDDEGAVQGFFALFHDMIAAHESPRTTKLYDRTTDEITLDEIERIMI